MSTGVDSAARVSISETLFVSELRHHLGGGIPLVSVAFDATGVRLHLAEGVGRFASHELLARAGSAAAAQVAGLLADDWRRHLEVAGPSAAALSWD